MSAAEEAAFWAELREAFPDEFGGVRADRLRDAEPDVALVELLESTVPEDPDLVDDLALIEVVAAWQRVASMAHARAARAAAALSRRECVQVAGGSVPVAPGERRMTTLRATGIEIAIRTGCTVRSGELLARDGRLFSGALSATGDALARGEIDARKSRQIADRLADLPLDTTVAVEDAVLPGAGMRSPGQLDRDLARALLEVDPDEGGSRHTRARRTRRVQHPRPLPDGMAGIWAVLPAEDAAQIDTRLTVAAAAARTAGDDRTVDQLRADGFVDLLLRATDPTSSRGGSGTGTGTGTVHVDVLVSLSTLLGLDDAPGELAGYGALSAEQSRALAAGGAWRRIVTDPLSGTVLDVGRTRYRPTAGLRDHVIARDRVCGRPGCTVPAHRAELDHTIPFGASRLHGHDGDGHGDGEIEVGLGVGAGEDPPPAPPPPPRQGDTADHNLAPLCPSDHTAKTLGVLHLEQPEPGVLEWTTATGLRVRVVPGRHGQARLLPIEPPPF